MKTKHILTAAVMLTCYTAMQSQTEKKNATVRIKKIENINGVEKITDTTYTSNDLSTIRLDQGDMDIRETTDKDGKTTKTVIINKNGGGTRTSMDEKDVAAISISSDAGGVIESQKTEINLEPGNTREYKMISIGKPMSPEEEALFENQMKKIMQDNVSDINRSGNSINEEQMVGKNLMIKKAPCGANAEELEKTPVAYHITIIKRVEIKDASAAEMEAINKHSGSIDNKLAIDKLHFYPNPNNGKFHLNFNLSTKGTTDIDIFNMEGKSVYNESLKDFSGSYDKEMDISAHPKGVYFVKVKQGEHAQLKKIVME